MRALLSTMTTKTLGCAFFTHTVPELRSVCCALTPFLPSACVLCLDLLCVALFVRTNGHPELDQALVTARGVQDGPRATAGRRWPKTVGQTSL